MFVWLVLVFLGDLGLMGTAVATELPVGVAVDLVSEGWSGSDDAHLAASDVHQLGQLVDPGAAQPMPDGRAARVVRRRPLGAALLLGVRGPRGGYQLARERRRISIGDIVRVVRAVNFIFRSAPFAQTLQIDIIGQVRKNKLSMKYLQNNFILSWVS